MKKMKDEDVYSELEKVLLTVPQGSVLSALLYFYCILDVSGYWVRLWLPHFNTFG